MERIHVEHLVVDSPFGALIRVGAFRYLLTTAKYSSKAQGGQRSWTMGDPELVLAAALQEPGMHGGWRIVMTVRFDGLGRKLYLASPDDATHTIELAGRDAEETLRWADEYWS